MEHNIAFKKKTTLERMDTLLLKEFAKNFFARLHILTLDVIKKELLSVGKCQLVIETAYVQTIYFPSQSSIKSNMFLLLGFSLQDIFIFNLI